MAKLLHNNQLILILFALLALMLLAIFASISYSAGNGNLLMPLDDVYIHFQYAKQMAIGQPYVYNPGQAATSGATSFLYPYLLAVGYLLGFKGLWLGLWAMLLGTVSLIAAQWAVYRLCQAFDCPQWLSVLTALTFALTGSVAWHFMSGMETGLMITLTLWTLLLVIEKRLRGFIIAATLLSMIRPEGGILVFMAAGTLFLRLWRDYGAHEKRPSKRYLLLLLLLPILAIGIQPLVNLMMTGTTVATGNQAKSILATVPHDWGIIIGRIVDNFVRMWWEFVTGVDRSGFYLPMFIGIFAFVGIVILLFKRNWRLIGLMLLGWLLASTAAISTLDTAFWHFKRYQMPMMALFFPLSMFTLNWLLFRPHPKPLPEFKEGLIHLLINAYVIVILPIFAIGLLVQFVNFHRLNVGYVYQQPYQMALWLRENTPEDAVIAVHDVGIMRYMGERTTLDIVGLTTPGAAAYWRNGPGSVAEFLINEQPDYIASYGYGHGYGLAYLADTSLYGEPLASFPIENWNREANVALAADFQGIYQPDWREVLYGSFTDGTPFNQCRHSPYGWPDGIETYYIIQVGDLLSESRYHYSWNSNDLEGFATEVRSFYTSQTPLAYRLINDYESFTFSYRRSEPIALILVTQVHALNAGMIDIYINDRFAGSKWIPEVPGQMVHITTLLEPEYLTDETQIRIVPNIDNGYYLPACHSIRLYQPEFMGSVSYPFPEDFIFPESLASYQNGAFYLSEFSTQMSTWDSNQFEINIDMFSPDGQNEGDYRFFAHLYNDVNESPIEQEDRYLGWMPVGNWLPGTLSDTITLNTENVPSGTYSLAIGFYNPQTGERLIPTSDVYEVSADGRLWLGEVTIGE